jgi:hypothetical protein
LTLTERAKFDILKSIKEPLWGLNHGSSRPCGGTITKRQIAFSPPRRLIVGEKAICLFVIIFAVEKFLG